MIMPAPSLATICACAVVVSLSSSVTRADDLPIDFSVFTEGALARAVVANDNDGEHDNPATKLARWRQYWFEKSVPGYAEASRLAQYAVDGRGTYWISNTDSTIFEVIFDPYKWVHVKYPWEAQVVYLTRKKHIRLLEM